MNAPKNPPKTVLKGCVALLVVGALFGGILLLTPLPRKIYHGLLQLVRESREKETVVVEVEPPAPEEEPEPDWTEFENDIDVVVRDLVARIKEGEPVPGRDVNYKSIDTTKLWNGIEVKSEVNFADGGPASEVRESPLSYHYDFKINVTVPKAVVTSEGLAASNGALPAALPGLEKMLPGAKISGMYQRLYDIKTKRVQQFVTRLNSAPDRHNFYDCETLLELTHPDTKQKVFFIQGDMDVVSDGSDGDRMPESDEYIANSDNYQPFTSYGWPKKTAQPNPLLARWQKKLAVAEADLAAGRVRQSRLATHKSNIAIWKREIADMKGRSCLIARADPFIVIPTWMRGAANPGDGHAPNVGDYAAVVFGDRVFPAIVGDTGPTWKVGEASLRLAKEINPKSSPYSRPVSKLQVFYLIFPGSREKPAAPDLEKWHSAVAALLAKVGGLGEGVELHSWSNYFEPVPAE